MRWLSRLTILVSLTLAACGPNSPTLTPNPTVINTLTPPTTTPTPANSPVPEPTATPIAQTTVRIIHAAPDAPSVNVFAGQSAIATNLEFSRATEATPINADTYILRVVPTGSTAETPSLAETEVALHGGEPILLILAGTGNQTELLVLPEPITGLNAGESAVTLLPIISGSPEITLAQGSTTLASATYGETASAILPPGAEALDVRAGEITLQTFNEEREAGTHTLLLITGDPAKPHLISFSTRAPGKTALRVVNASAINSIDIYLDEKLFAHQAEYGRPAARQDITTGEHTIAAYAANTDPAITPPLARQAFSLENTPYSTLYLLGSADHPLLRVDPDDLDPTLPGEATITFVNTLQESPTLQLEMNGKVLANATYGEIPQTISLAESRYTFFWSNTSGTNESQTVEVVENLELKAGYSYLYLVTGRRDAPPIVIGESVGTADNLADASGEPAAQVRLINALEDQQTLDFLADETLLATVVYSQGTDLLAIPQRTPIIRIQANESSLAELPAILESGKRYTIVAYGLPGEKVNLLLLPDKDLIFGGNDAHLRLINASLNPDVALGLGYTIAGPAIANEPEGTEEPTIDQFRRSIPVGLSRLVNDVVFGTASANILMTAGTFNLEILDSNRTQIATTLSTLELQAGEHYDVIAYQETEVPRVRAFGLLYPERSD